MTCIVGKVDGGGTVWLGGDSLATYGKDSWACSTMVEPKVARIGPFVIGHTGGRRTGQIAASTLMNWSVTDYHHGRPRTLEFMVGPFIDRLREALKAGGALNCNDGLEAFDCDFLVGTEGHLFRVAGGDMAVAESTHGIDAIGAGGELALGAMHARSDMAGSVDEPEFAIINALTIAERLCAGVRAPFHVVSVPCES